MYECMCECVEVRIEQFKLNFVFLSFAVERVLDLSRSDLRGELFGL